MHCAKSNRSYFNQFSRYKEYAAIHNEAKTVNFFGYETDQDVFLAMTRDLVPSLLEVAVHHAKNGATDEVVTRATKSVARALVLALRERLSLSHSDE